MICLVVSFTFVNCDNASEPVTQTIEQTTQEVEKPIAKATTEDKEEAEETLVTETTKEAEAATPTAPKKRPILSFKNKTFDYGMIEQGDKVSHTFHFTNKGEADLVIKNAEASCGCTTPTYPFIPIKPGETGTISVTFNSTGKMGTQRPHVTVSSNSYPRTQTLYLEGFVTDQIAKKEETKPIIEEGININPEDNVTKGGDVKVDDVKEDDN